MASFTEKEAGLLKACMNNFNGGHTAMLKQIDFDKVFGPAAYKDATNAKVMFGRLLSKIVDEGVKGTPGRSKATRKGKGKTKQTSAAGGFDDAPALGESANDDNHSSPSTAKTTKKRKTAASTKDGTPSKRGRGNPKKSEVKEEEKVVVGSGSNEGIEAADAVKEEQGGEDQLPVEEEAT